MWDIIQNIIGTENQRNEVIKIGLEQLVSFIELVSVSLFEFI